MAKAERISAVLLVAGGVFIAAYSFHELKLGILISPGAGFLPFYYGIAIIILAALWLVKTLFPKPPATADTGEGCGAGDVPGEDIARIWGLPRKMILGLAVLIAYGWLFEKIGYFLSTSLFMFGWQTLVERESLLKAVIITALSAGILYTLFLYLLGVQLPPGTWLP
ncbi:MAG: tripartite tricarboxylate transporter TctB family protein [Syntrophales bacterium]|nr:tripartite tricarboxylate transporter TctB family protein [Syntrophales bacterium]